MTAALASPAEGFFKRPKVVRDGVDLDGRLRVSSAETIEGFPLLEKPFAVLSFEGLRVLQPNLDGEIRCRGVAIRIDPVLGGQLEQIVVVFCRPEVFDEVQPLNRLGRHLLIGFGEDASQCRQIDLASLQRGEGEPFHLEKEPERLKEPEKDFRLKSLQLVRLGKTLQFERHLDTPL